MKIMMTKKELASVSGYSYRQLYNIDRDLPENEKLFVIGEGDKYDLALFVQRWVAYNTGKAISADRTLDEVKAEHEGYKMRKTELEVARMEGELVDVREVKKLWGNIANLVMQTMLKLPSKIAPMLVMLGSAERIRDILDTELRAALDTIADTPLPEDEAAEETELMLQ